MKSITSTHKTQASVAQKQLLRSRLCDLEISLSGTMVEECTATLSMELERRGLKVRPYFWVSTEWFCMDGTSGIAIPFYLLNSRLKKIEKLKIGYVDGAGRSEILKILRHEMGHVMENVYGLRNHPLRKSVFGDSKKKMYPASYKPQPYSRKFVKNLSDGYAQSHSDEDFAETFAVWMQPKHIWMKSYKNRPECMKKLLAVDHLMDLIKKGKLKKRVLARRESESVTKNKKTLSSHYSEKKRNLRIGPSLINSDVFEDFFEKLDASRAKLSFEDMLVAIKLDFKSIGVRSYELKPIFTALSRKLISQNLQKSQKLFNNEQKEEFRDLILLEYLDRFFYRRDRIYL